MTQLRTVPVAQIAPSPDNTRLFDRKDKEDKVSLVELAASIRELGLQQPPKVRPNPTSSTQPWVLVFGERRLRAMRDILKRTDITVLVDEDLASDDASAATVVENLQRRDLHPMDEARGIAILRGQGASIKDIAKRLGRREDWVKERLKLCDLPRAVQDLYRRSPRMTLQATLELHDFTHGGKDNKGFPALIAALARTLADSGTASLSQVAAAAPDLVVAIHHAYSAGYKGTWAGNYFDTRSICTKCPFAAYQPGYYDGVGYCVLPTHYAELKAKGKAKYDEAQAVAQATQAASGAVPTAAPTWQPAPVETASEKGKKTRQRHKDQKAAYTPTVSAVERAVDMIPGTDPVDLAVLCAYTLTTDHVESKAVDQVITRHALKKGFPAPQTTPGRAMIERLRSFDGVELVRYTLEALLLTQAMRARDYDPGKTPADPVLALYLPGQAVPSPAAEGESLATSEREDEEVVDDELIDDEEGVA